MVQGTHPGTPTSPAAAPIFPPVYTSTPLRVVPETANMTAEEVKEALIEHATHECCFSVKPASQMEIVDVKMNSAFHVSQPTVLHLRTLTIMTLHAHDSVV